VVEASLEEDEHTSTRKLKLLSIRSARSKSIVLKDVPPLTRMSGVPAKARSKRGEACEDSQFGLEQLLDQKDWWGGNEFFEANDISSDEAKIILSDLEAKYAGYTAGILNGWNFS